MPYITLKINSIIIKCKSNVVESYYWQLLKHLQTMPKCTAANYKRHSIPWTRIYLVLDEAKHLCSRGVVRSFKNSKMESFATIVNSDIPLAIVASLSNLGVCKDPGYASMLGFCQCRSSHQRCSIKVVLKNFAIFTGKHLCWSLF